MYLFDTTHCIRFIYGDPDLKLKPGAQIATCLIVRGELMFGVYKSELFEENLYKVDQFLQNIKVFDLDEETANTYGRLKAAILERFGPRLRSKLRNTTTESLGFKENNLWIASTAIRYNLVLVSGDSHIFRLGGIEGLMVEDW